MQACCSQAPGANSSYGASDAWPNVKMPETKMGSAGGGTRIQQSGIARCALGSYARTLFAQFVASLLIRLFGRRPSAWMSGSTCSRTGCIWSSLAASPGSCGEPEARADTSDFRRQITHRAHGQDLRNLRNLRPLEACPDHCGRHRKQAQIIGAFRV